MVHQEDFNGFYFKIKNDTIRDNNLTLKSKGLLALMLSFSESWTFSIKHLITLSKCGEKAVRSALSELIKTGYAKKVVIREKNGRFEKYDYIVCQTLQQQKRSDNKQTKESAIPDSLISLIPKDQWNTRIGCKKICEKIMQKKGLKAVKYYIEYANSYKTIESYGAVIYEAFKRCDYESHLTIYNEKKKKSLKKAMVQEEIRKKAWVAEQENIQIQTELDSKNRTIQELDKQTITELDAYLHSRKDEMNSQFKRCLNKGKLTVLRRDYYNDFVNSRNR
jgi:hypothetical protein